MTVVSLHITSFVFWGRLTWLRTVYYFCCCDFVVSDLKAVWSGPTAASQRQWNMNVMRTALVESCRSYGCKAEDRIWLEPPCPPALYTLCISWWRGERGEECTPTMNPIIHMSAMVCFCLLFSHFSRYFCLLYALSGLIYFLAPSSFFSFFCLTLSPSFSYFLSVIFPPFTPRASCSPCPSLALAEEPFPDLWRILRESREGPEAAAGAQ